MRYVHGVLWPLLTVACQQPAPAPPPDPGPPAAEQVAALGEELTVALALWRSARYPEAQQTVQAAYADHFEPLEPALSASDPASALALEYAFGRLSWQMRRSGDPEAVSAAVAELSAAIEQWEARVRVYVSRAGAERGLPDDMRTGILIEMTPDVLKQHLYLNQNRPDDYGQFLY